MAMMRLIASLLLLLAPSLAGAQVIAQTNDWSVMAVTNRAFLAGQQVRYTLYSLQGTNAQTLSDKTMTMSVRHAMDNYLYGNYQGSLIDSTGGVSRYVISGGLPPSTYIVTISASSSVQTIALASETWSVTSAPPSSANVSATFTNLVSLEWQPVMEIDTNGHVRPYGTDRSLIPHAAYGMDIGSTTRPVNLVVASNLIVYGSVDGDFIAVDENAVHTNDVEWTSTYAKAATALQVETNYGAGATLPAVDAGAATNLNPAQVRLAAESSGTQLTNVVSPESLSATQFVSRVGGVSSMMSGPLYMDVLFGSTYGLAIFGSNSASSGKAIYIGAPTSSYVGADSIQIGHGLIMHGGRSLVVGNAARGGNYSTVYGHSANGGGSTIGNFPVAGGWIGAGHPYGNAAVATNAGIAFGYGGNGSQTNIAIGHFATANAGSWRTAIGHAVTNSIDNSTLVRGTLMSWGGSGVFWQATTTNSAGLPAIPTHVWRGIYDDTTNLYYVNITGGVTKITSN